MTSVLEAIGNTPLIRLQRLPTGGRVFVKVEGQNIGGSVKDRPALQMLRDLLDAGAIAPDTLLVEPTSGNTGVGLAMVCAALGLRLAVCMPESMSVERRRLVAAYGAELVLTPAAEGMRGAVAAAERLVAATPGARIVG